MIHNLIIKYDLTFDVTLGTCNTKSIDIEIQLYIKPYHKKPYPVPRSHKYVFNKEVEIKNGDPPSLSNQKMMERSDPCPILED